LEFENLYKVSGSQDNDTQMLLFVFRQGKITIVFYQYWND